MNEITKVNVIRKEVQKLFLGTLQYLEAGPVRGTLQRLISRKRKEKSGKYGV